MSIGLYWLNAGMISDYLQKDTEADKYYSSLMSIKGLDFTIFQARIISNFYFRHENPLNANNVLNKVKVKNNPVVAEIIKDIKKAKISTQPIITSPQIGVAEVFFAIATVLHQEKEGEEVALLFASLASYLNPDYDETQLFMANILESKELYNEANEIYSQIESNTHYYTSAQIQIAANLIRLKEYEKAEDILQRLVKTYKPTVDMYTNLGEIMRMTKRYRNAIVYYQKAMDFYTPKQKAERWNLLMTMAIAYNSMNDMENAEKILRQAMKILPNATTRNHLGYILIKDKRNIEEAFDYIVSAYLENPHEGSIIDSLGMAFYQIGNYEKAIKYFEEASALSSSEAVIYEHLGDAYWDAGRHTEAVFQWNHAISLQDNFNEVDKNAVKKKISIGKPAHQPVAYDKTKIDKFISKLSSEN